MFRAKTARAWLASIRPLTRLHHCGQIPRMTENTHNYGEPRGIGGWLASLIFLLCVFVPLNLTYDQYSDMADAEKFFPFLLELPDWQVMKTIRWWATGAVVASSMAAGFLLLFMRNARTRYFAIAGIWLAFLVIPAVTLIVTHSMILHPGVKLNHFGNVMIIPMEAIIITAYLLISKRVKNTYCRGDAPTSVGPVASAA